MTRETYREALDKYERAERNFERALSRAQRALWQFWVPWRFGQRMKELRAAEKLAIAAHDEAMRAAFR